MASGSRPAAVVARRCAPIVSSAATVPLPYWIAVEVITKLRCRHAECLISAAEAPIVRRAARCRAADLPPFTAEVPALRHDRHHRRAAVDALLSLAGQDTRPR